MPKKAIADSPSSRRKRAFNETCAVFSLFAGYCAFSLMRKAYSVSNPSLISSLHFSKVDIGLIATNFSIAYGLSKFVAGILSDIFPADVLFAGGLFLSSLFNIVFTMLDQLYMLCAVSFLQGVVQGFGWPSLCRIVTENVDPRNIGTVWSLLVTAGNLGYLIFLIFPLLPRCHSTSP
jgi:sugar phosphate permease